MSKIDTKRELEKIDDALDSLREAWMDSKKEKKSVWMGKINKVLDDRLEIMKIRDGK